MPFLRHRPFLQARLQRQLGSELDTSLDAVETKLRAGAKVGDVGCAHGASTIVMAQAYPKSKFFGFDYHQPSLDRAATLAKKAGVGDRITFERASAKHFAGNRYDLVAFFDCLHDMGDPVGAGKHVKQAWRRTVLG